MRAPSSLVGQEGGSEDSEGDGFAAQPVQSSVIERRAKEQGQGFERLAEGPYVSLHVVLSHKH